MPAAAPTDRAAAGHLGRQVAGQLEALLRLHGPGDRTAARVRQIYALLTGESLDRPAAPPFGGLSFINAGGLPFQWVLRFAPGTGGWGFLCESGRPRSPPEERLSHSLDRVARACAAAGGAEPGFLAQIADLLLPRPTEVWPEHWRSALWSGVAVSGDAVSVRPYFNLNRGTCRDRWLRAGWVLKALGREAALRRLCDLSGRCSQDSWPVGLAVDVVRDGSAGRVKLYFRSAPTTTAWLARWYDAVGFASEACVVRRFLDLLGVAGGDWYPASGFIVSLEIHADERFSLKTDLAVTKWLGSDAAILEPARAMLRHLGADAGQLGRSLAAIGAGCVPDGAALTRFVGLGLEPGGAPHLNLYVEPPLLAAAKRCDAARPARAQVSRVMRRGLAALLAARDGEGWTDFTLPVGPSDAWVTAYVLAMLADLPGDLRGAYPAEIGGALDWLARARTPGGGWGYSAWVPDDADSTAWAVIALRAWNRPVAAEAQHFLRRCRRRRGFATYPPDTSPRGAWAQVTPDVTAVASRAVGGRPRAADSDGHALPAGYWWSSPLYTAAMRLEAGERPELRGVLAAFLPAGAFERALLLRAHLRLGVDRPDLARELAEAQRGDGLWPGSALLRLPRDGVLRPEAVIDSGPLYRDEGGVFTTATVLGALGLAAAWPQRRRSAAGR